VRRASAGSRDAESSLPQRLTGFSLGIEASGGHFVTLIAQGAAVPARGCTSFTTVTDRQRAVEIRVLRHAGARSTTLVGRFLLAGLRAANHGEPRIEIGLALDRHGVLRAWAEEKATGAREAATFSAFLSSADLEPLLAEMQARATRRQGIPQGDIWNELEEIRLLQGETLRSPSRGAADLTAALHALGGELSCLPQQASVPRLCVVAHDDY
jgi:hypothetical protein